MVYFLDASVIFTHALHLSSHLMFLDGDKVKDVVILRIKVPLFDNHYFNNMSVNSATLNKETYRLRAKYKHTLQLSSIIPHQSFSSDRKSLLLFSSISLRMRNP
jgi:hypothetical protein